MLYEALTGRLPFLGAPLQVLSDKVRFEPPAPRQLRRGIPEDLDRLCVDLLRRKPSARPRAEEILRRLGMVDGPLPTVRTLSTHQTASTTFVGREEALETLQRSFVRAREGTCVRVWVTGPSGVGKTALVRRFLDGAGLDARPVVLSARCYERESVPYKAFDGVVDALSRYLRKLPRADCEAYMPRDAAVLARVFPVLARVPAIADAPRRAGGGGDAQEMRARAFVALRDLLARIADRQPLVIFIDDVHWGDLDSAMLLAQLTAPPDAPSMLVILTHRSEESGSDIVRAFRQEGGTPQRDDVGEIVLDQLKREEAVRLAAALLGTDVRDSVTMQIADEGGGNALFVSELARYVQTKPSRGSASGIRLELVLRDRVQDLGEAPRRLLEILAIAARPVPLEVARQAAGLEADEGMQASTALRLAHFIRTSAMQERNAIEIAHDRVREAALALLTEEEQRAQHAELADALRASGNADPELMFTHFRAAERTERAIEYAEIAAARAERALAFDRAASFYRYALEARGKTDPATHALRVALGGTLGHAGRGREAAETFLEAARTANEAERLELQRRAAEQLLHSGHVDQGVEVVDAVLEALGMKMATTPFRALVTLVFLRAWLSVRIALAGSKPLRDESAIAPTILTRIDVCWSVGTGLAAVDTIRAAAYQTRNALYALGAREPYRLARALTVEAILQATGGPRAAGRAERVFSGVARMASETNHPVARAYKHLGDAGLAYFGGRFRTAADHFMAPEQPLRELTGETRWEQKTMSFYCLCALTILGEFNLAGRLLAPLLRSAEERGDLFLHTLLRVGDTNMLWLAHDDPDAAERVIDESMRRWSRRSFQTQHYYEMNSRGHIDLYRDRPRAALDRVLQTWRDLQRSMQMRIFVTRLKAHHLRARAALRVAAEEGDRTHLKLAVESARALAGDPCPPARGLAALVRAGIASVSGDPHRAEQHLSDAIVQLDRAGMKNHAAASRRALAKLVLGDQGAALEAAGASAMREGGARDIDRMTRFYLAGLKL